MQINKRGDTIIEVMLAIAIFALLAVITINLMNNGINSAQRTLEFTMARNEIDNQAEAIRYIHQSYVAERQLDKSASQFRTLWDGLRSIAQKAKVLEEKDNNGVRPVFDINQLESCSDAYAENGMVRQYNAFVLNTRLVLPDSNTKFDGADYGAIIDDIIVGVEVKDDGASGSGDKVSRLTPATLYPRIVYKYNKNTEDDIGYGRAISNGTPSTEDQTNESSSLAETKIYNRVARSEGVFIIVVGDNEKNPVRSNYFDFYIRSCWHSVGSISPSTITTIVRLYNPEVIE